MKLKNLLIAAFLLLTCIPSILVSLLLYKSGFELSKQSYTRNLTESISVQADYISQAFQNNMVRDDRFAKKALGLSADELYDAFQNYLEASEDQTTVCLLLDKDGLPLYTIGEKKQLDRVLNQLPILDELNQQMAVEFDLDQSNYALGIVTPVIREGQYSGSLISVYEKSFVTKIISSYYELSNTYTYICRKDGEIVSSRGHTNEEQQAYIQPALYNVAFQSNGSVDINLSDEVATGYYRNIFNTPWYLVGLIDNTQISSFTNQFVWVYLLLIGGIAVADILLAIYFSRRVIKPINSLIQVMDGYPDSLKDEELQTKKDIGYVETRYLRTKFLKLMNTISLIQHNFEGIYQLYQSSTMNDTNIDIDVMNQTARSNKTSFETLMHELVVPEGACIVERFTRCFCDKDQIMLMSMLEQMRDEHLAVAREAEVFTPHFSQKWFHVLVVPMYEQERLCRLFIQLRDVSSFKRQELESLDQASRDSLTGLYNRSGFITGVSRAIQEYGEKAVHGLLFLDMNDFKLVNDTFGHGAGDELLCSVGTMLKQTVGGSGVAARLGGDEFAIFLPGADGERVNDIKAKLNQNLVYPYQTSETAFVITASIGVSLMENPTREALEERLKEADTDMYRVKRQFKRDR